MSRRLLEGLSGPSPWSPSAKLERILIWHLWACAPFALAWAIRPDIFGRAQDPREILSVRAIYALAGLSLLVRTIQVYKWKGLGRTRYFWPIFDVALITSGLWITQPAPDSWVVILYTLPIAQAAATLDFRWALTIAALSALSCGFAGGIENVRYTYLDRKSVV